MLETVAEEEDENEERQQELQEDRFVSESVEDDKNDEPSMRLLRDFVAPVRRHRHDSIFFKSTVAYLQISY